LLGKGPESATDRNSATEADIDLAVRTNVELVRQHRGTLGRLAALVEKLMSQLEMTAEMRAELEQAIEEDRSGDKSGAMRNKMRAAVALPTNAAIARELSQVLKNVIPLERQAFNLDDKGEPPKGGSKDISADMTPQQAADAYHASLNDDG
jgi:hypothetical protein